MPYVIFLALAPTATAHLARPGVMDAVMEALQALTALGLPEDFARLFVQRLSHLLTLREAGILRAAHGPPRGLALRRVNRHLHNGARIDDRHPLYPKSPPCGRRRSKTTDDLTRPTRLEMSMYVAARRYMSERSGPYATRPPASTNSLR